MMRICAVVLCVCGASLVAASSQAGSRAWAALGGLQQYYHNTTFGAWKSCGQIGGAGGKWGPTPNAFGCACEKSTGPNCLSCYRWWDALAVDAIVNLASIDATNASRAQFAPVVRKIHARSPYRKELAETMDWLFVDDYAWFVLAWTRAYEWLREEQFLTTAKVTFDYLHQRGWDSQGGCGGYYWEVPQKNHKNAITNLEMLHASARLALLTGESKYKVHALEVWEWFSVGRFVNAHHLVNDGVTAEVTIHQEPRSRCCNGTTGNMELAKCVNDQGTIWTYNQAMYFGAAALLYNMTGNSTLQHIAIEAFEAALLHLTVDGVLTERQRPANVGAAQCSEKNDPAGGDLWNFKGVFMQQTLYFLQTVPLTSEQRQRAFDFVRKNSDSAWNNRLSPPFNSSYDICNEPLPTPAYATFPKFEWFWAHAGLNRSCTDARTQISSLSLFVTDYYVQTQAPKQPQIFAV